VNENVYFVSRCKLFHRTPFDEESRTKQGIATKKHTYQSYRSITSEVYFKSKTAFGHRRLRDVGASELRWLTSGTKVNRVM